MTLTLELTPEEEARLRTVANGKSLEEAVRSLIKQIPNNARAWEEDMLSLSEGSEALSVLMPEAYSRKSIYEEPRT